MHPHGGQRTWTGRYSYARPLSLHIVEAGHSERSALQRLSFESCLAIASLALCHPHCLPSTSLRLHQVAGTKGVVHDCARTRLQG